MYYSSFSSHPALFNNSQQAHSTRPSTSSGQQQLSLPQTPIIDQSIRSSTSSPYYYHHHHQSPMDHSTYGRDSPGNLNNNIPFQQIHHHHQFQNIHHQSRQHHNRHPPSIGPNSFQIGSPSPSTISEDKLIDALINKIMAKLSNQADPHLSPLETDELILQSCSSLFEMCRQRLPFVIQKLLQELDSPSHPFTSDEQTGLVDHLRTQLFVIKILSYCMSYHWAWHREQTQRQRLPSRSRSPSPPPPPPSYSKSAPNPPIATDWSDPPALDDNLAKQLVATISFFLKEHQRFEDAGSALGPIGSSNHHLTDLTRKQSIHSTNHGTSPNSLPNHTFHHSSRDLEEKPIVPSLMSEILAQVAKICFFVSASNWTIVLELSAQFVHLQRPAQSDIALALRRSIWNWIETYPHEYVALVRSNGRLEGAPDVLFDVAHSLSENGKKRAYTWPMMSMLLAVCPDIVLKIAAGDRNRSQVTARKAAFIESLRKNLKVIKLADVATACCVDLCKAATFSPKTTAEGPGLRLLALDLVSDLNSRLLDPSKPFTNADGMVEVSLMSEALAALFKLDRHYVDSTLLDKCLSRNSFPPFQIAFIQACQKLATKPAKEANASNDPEAEDDQDCMSNWNVKLQELYPLIAPLLRGVFMSLILECEQFSHLTTDRSTSKTIGGGGLDENPHRNDILRAILKLWGQDCRLAFYSNVKNDHSNPGRSSLELQAWLTGGGTANPNDLEMFIYLTTFLLDGRSPRSVRQSTMDVFKAYYQPIQPSPRHLESPIIKQGSQNLSSIDLDLKHSLKHSRPIVGICILKRLLETWAHREEEREVLHVFKVYLDRFKDAVEDSEKGNSLFSHLNHRSSLFHSQESYLSAGANAVDYIVFGHLLRLAIPLGLCTVDQYNLALLLRCSRDMISLLERYPTLLKVCGLDSTMTSAQLSATVQGLPDDGKGLGGRVAQAKRARLVMKTMSMNSPLIHPLWDEALRRWKILSGLVGHRPFDDHSGDLPIQDPVTVSGGLSGEGVQENTYAWISISGLLTSTASYEPAKVKNHASNSSLGLYIPRDLLPERFYATPDRARNVDRYLQEMVDLLVADDLRMREGVKDALGTELSVSLFPILLKHLKSIVAHFFEHGRPKPQSPFTHFIEQAISIRHFDYLTHMLSEIAKLETKSLRLCVALSKASNANGREPTAALQRELSSITRELVEVSSFRDQTMNCLIKLMGSNMNPAFRYFVNMFHHPDLRIRQAQIQILRDVIKESGHQLPKLVKPVKENGLEKIIDMICRPDLTLALALCKVCGSADFEELTEIILNIFDCRKGVIKFLKAVIEKEVSETEHESTVFRGNSFTTRLLTVFARAKGYDYLRNTLANLLLGLSNKPSEFSMDFDPHRASADDDEASRNLEQVTEAFLNVIAVSWKKLPSAIREICHHIATTVQERYPESVFTSIGGFIFLRFINPAIVSPEVIDLDLPNDTREIRRSLVMITRVLQALANNIRFGAREPAMKALNPFMAKNIYPMTRFLKDISSVDESLVTDDDTEMVTSEEGSGLAALDEASRYVLHRFLFDHMDKIGAELKASQPTLFKHWHDGSEKLWPGMGQEIWMELQKVMNEIGPPGSDDPDLPLNENQVSGSEYYAYLAKFELLKAPDVRMWQSSFFEAPRSRNQASPTFVLLACRIKAEICDLESFYLYILNCLENVDGPFSIFLDCTGFSFMNEISIPWFRQLLDLAPAQSSMYVANIWVYNSNASFRRYLKKLSEHTAERTDRRWTGAVKAVSTLDELASCLPNYEQVLPNNSWNMFHDKRIVISHVTHLQQFQMQIPVVFHIGPKSLLIRSAKRLELLSDSKCTLNDVIRLKDIEEMQRLPPSNVHSDPGFIIKQYGCNGVLKFVSVNTDRIIETLSAAQAELFSGPTDFEFRQKYLKPSIIYGSLLNGAIFNLCSSDPSIRMSALSFLQGLARAMHIDRIDDIVPVPGGYVPRVGVMFVGDISDRLARAMPSVTLSFVDEYFDTISTASPSELVIYIHAFKPWLQNLAGCLVCPREEYESVRTQVKSALRRLIELTLNQIEMQSMLHARIWPSLARQETILPLVIEELAVSAVNFGASSPRFTEVCEIAVSVNSINFQGKLLHRLRRAIARTTSQPVAMIADSPEWPEITALIRMEMSISFTAHLQSQLYLPDVLHIVTMLVGTGSASHRSSIYSIVVNTVSCLCSLSQQQATNSEGSALFAILKRLGQSPTQALFGLNPNEVRVNDQDDLTGRNDPISSISLESIVQLLIEVVRVASPSLDTANRWRSRWASLVTSTCFQANPALQPRAFVVLGFLLTEEVDDDLLFQVLSALKPALGQSNGVDRSLATSIISCSAKVLAGVGPNSPYRAACFWTGVGLLQIEDPAIYASALKLTRSAVHELCKSETLGKHHLSHYLLDSRDEGTVEVLMQIEECCGLRFDNGEGGNINEGAAYFGFALSGALIKGLRHAQIAQDAEDFLEMLLIQTTKEHETDRRGSPAPDEEGSYRINSESLPYFTTLLPIAARTGRLARLFDLAGADRKGFDSASISISYGFIVDQLAMSDHETALLVVSLMTSLILTADDESELVFLYGMLAELVHRDSIPHIMLLVQSELSGRIQEIMRTSENTTLLNACQTVMFPHHPRAVGSPFLARLTEGMIDATDLLSILTQLGFSGILIHNCFYENDEGGSMLGHGTATGGKEYDHRVARLCVQLVSCFCRIKLSFKD
ncbi:hypothetical protein DFH28DRAFT_1080087 [Melampsora americana]|nr:hypothetical protein DFH28DRAFT_1080087 [Melampsora americana]